MTSQTKTTCSAYAISDVTRSIEAAAALESQGYPCIRREYCDQHLLIVTHPDAACDSVRSTILGADPTASSLSA